MFCKERTPRVPERVKPKNKFTKCGTFLTPGIDRKNHHVYHAFHHTFTIKKPRSAPCFLQNPLQKRAFCPRQKNSARAVQRERQISLWKELIRLGSPAVQRL